MAQEFTIRNLRPYESGWAFEHTDALGETKTYHTNGCGFGLFVLDGNGCTSRQILGTAQFISGKKPGTVRRQLNRIFAE